MSPHARQLPPVGPFAAAGLVLTTWVVASAGLTVLVAGTLSRNRPYAAAGVAGLVVAAGLVRALRRRGQWAAGTETILVLRLFAEARVEAFVHRGRSRAGGAARVASIPAGARPIGPSGPGGLSRRR